MDGENVVELEELIESEARGRHIVLELHDLTLVDSRCRQVSRALRSTQYRT